MMLTDTLHDYSLLSSFVCMRLVIRLVIVAH